MDSRILQTACRILSLVVGFQDSWDSKILGFHPSIPAVERLEFFFLEGCCKLLVVGPAGGRISTGDCSRVLNVNRSLYSSTSRGRVQAALAKHIAALDPTCTTLEAPVDV